MTGEIPYVSYMHHFVVKILNKIVLCPLCKGFPLKTSQKVLAIGEHPLY